MHTSAFLRLMARNGLHIGPTRLGMAAILLGTGGINSGLGALQGLFYGRRIRATHLCGDPIFIIGHWRSGTTLLHEYLVLDQRHTFANTYACFAPNHYLLTRSTLPRWLNFLMPSQRPMDAMAAGWDHPQEDEFALCNMGVPSPYLTMAFPNQSPQYPEYRDLAELPPRAVARWKKQFLWFLKCVTVADPKRIVLKSPPHTARIRTLLEMFPDARFVHIVRDPYVLFPSTCNLWRRLWRDWGLQKPHYRQLNEYVFDNLVHMYEAFDRDRGLIHPARFSEVRYEDLVADPVQQMRRIYGELEMGEFDRVRPVLEDYVAGQSGYKKNRYEIDAATRAEIARRWAGYLHRYGYAKAKDAA